MAYHNEVNEKEVLKNDDGFIELAKRLPKPDIYKEIQDAVPLSKTSVYRVPQITWRHFEKIPNFPSGLLPIGDTNCRINPVFGQGMSIAILEALALRRLLRDKRNNFEKLFLNEAAKTIAPIWGIVLTEDFRYPETAGEKPVGLSFQQWYAKKIFILSAENQFIYDSLVRVMNLVSPMTILMKPRIVGTILKSLISRTDK